MRLVMGGGITPFDQKREKQQCDLTGQDKCGRLAVDAFELYYIFCILVQVSYNPYGFQLSI